MQEHRRDPMIEEALRWLVVLQDEDASDADRRSFELWLKRDRRHADAWRRAQHVWARADSLQPALGERRIVLGPGNLPNRTSPNRDAVPARVGRRRWLQAAAAAAAVAVPAGILLSRPGLFADHATAIGERRSVSLEDGSTIELASGSSLSVDFAADARRIVLHDGQAFFTVARDSARPFVVDAAAGRTLALGTAFDIKRMGDSVTVAVTEHSVAVSVPGAERVIVEQGQQVRYGARTVGVVRDADLEQIEAWRHDRLIFHEAPLGEVIADLERYRGGRIVMTDSRLRRMPVTAVFDTRQTDAALDTIAGTLPIRMRRLTDLLVILSPKT